MIRLTMVAATAAAVTAARTAMASALHCQNYGVDAQRPTAPLLWHPPVCSRCAALVRLRSSKRRSCSERASSSSYLLALPVPVPEVAQLLAPALAPLFVRCRAVPLAPFTLNHP